MNAPPAVRLARGDETETVAGILHESFVDEAGLNYWLKQGPVKERARKRFFDAAVRDAVHPKRDLWLAEDGGERLGAAIWLAPGLKAFDFTFVQEMRITPLLFSIAGIKGMARARALGQRLAHSHPTEPHAHLVFLGVAPSAQGRGVGSAMLKSMLAPLDERGVTAYLEASTPRNVALYQRHGFEVTDSFSLPGLDFWCMTRKPR